MLQVLKRLRSTKQNHESLYLDLRYILATSDSCERLFSTSGYVMGKRCQLKLPENFECQLYFHVNCHLLETSDVNEMLQ